MKRLIGVFIVGVAIGIIVMNTIQYMKIKKNNDLNTLFGITVNVEFINVRAQATITSKKIYEVSYTEKYRVVEVYNDDEEYTWYKIIYYDTSMGWIASEKASPWVIEHD